jgi:hypothetical protein
MAWKNRRKVLTSLLVILIVVGCITPTLPIPNTGTVSSQAEPTLSTMTVNPNLVVTPVNTPNPSLNLVPTHANEETATAVSQTLYDLEIQGEVARAVIEQEELLPVFAGLYLDTNSLNLVILVTERSDEVRTLLVHNGVEPTTLKVRVVQNSEQDLQQAHEAVYRWLVEDYPVEVKELWSYQYGIDTPGNRVDLILHPKAWVQLSDFDPQGQAVPYTYFPATLQKELEISAPNVTIQLLIGEVVITDTEIIQ